MSEHKQITPADRAVCVYCASSRRCDPEYHQAAHRLGSVLANNRYMVIYGGGAVGSMGALADGAIAAGGRVIGVIPRFMQDLEWGHKGLAELRLVEDMRSRKHMMVSGSVGVVALPGGCGTFEELLETITLKRLGLYLNPIIIVNTRRYYDPLLELLSSAISEKFMDERHGAIWQVVQDAEQVPEVLESAPKWGHEARTFAVP